LNGLSFYRAIITGLIYSGYKLEDEILKYQPNIVYQGALCSGSSYDIKKFDKMIKRIGFEETSFDKISRILFGSDNCYQTHNEHIIISQRIGNDNTNTIYHDEGEYDLMAKIYYSDSGWICSLRNRSIPKGRNITYEFSKLQIDEQLNDTELMRCEEMMIFIYSMI
jgi:DNA-binding Lrp family transcriptional regulator